MVSNEKQIKYGALLAYGSIVLNVIAGLIYTPWMINQIGESDYGLYTLSNSLVTLFVLDFGLGSATNRYVSKYRAEGREDKINDFLGLIYKLYFAIDVVIFVALLTAFVFIDRIYIGLTPEELDKFKKLYIIAASFAILNFPFVTFNGILAAFEKFIQLKLADVIYRVLIIAFTVLALTGGYGVFALLTVHVAVSLILIAYKGLIIYKQIPIKPNYGFFRSDLFKDIFNFSLWETINPLAQKMVFNITPSILGMVTNSEAIAIFGVVSTIEGYVATISSAISGMFMPRISRIYAKDNASSNIMSLFLKVGRFQFGLNGLVVIGFLLIGKDFISIWMGSGYLDAYYGILLVIIPGLFYNSLQIANTALIVQKKVNIQAYITLGTGCVNIMLSLPLSQSMGVLGACLSIFCAYTFRAIVQHIVHWRILKLDIASFIKRCYMRIGSVFLLTFIFGFAINYIFVTSGWLSLLVKATLITGVYGLLLFVIAVTEDERLQIVEMLKRIYKPCNCR